MGLGQVVEQPASESEGSVFMSCIAMVDIPVMLPTQDRTDGGLAYPIAVSNLLLSQALFTKGADFRYVLFMELG